MKYIKTEIDINASAARVWTILADLDQYSQWNPLIRRASGVLREHGLLQLFICTPGLANRNVRVTVLKSEANCELRWLGRLFMRHLLDGDHCFIITPLDQGRVRVIQKEAFSGILVPIVARWLMPNMRLGFEAMNVALKRRAELLIDV